MTRFTPEITGDGLAVKAPVSVGGATAVTDCDCDVEVPAALVTVRTYVVEAPEVGTVANVPVFVVTDLTSGPFAVPELIRQVSGVAPPLQSPPPMLQLSVVEAPFVTVPGEASNELTSPPGTTWIGVEMVLSTVPAGFVTRSVYVVSVAGATVTATALVATYAELSEPTICAVPFENAGVNVVLDPEVIVPAPGTSEEPTGAGTTVYCACTEEL
jgi:hypothetical protein